ncbi:hypothetical protein [Paenibacillus campi]|uniref:hypothetical protein n=1 Tax=Paenibacillus campi TaxID=3106031 RepID=UPI002AFE20F8|nr:hypothetical protein [Paenibacillus sp. SGZ-1014]
MYSFLGEHHNKVLNQIDSKVGVMQLDFSDEAHYGFFLDEVGGLGKFESEHPELVHLLEDMRHPRYQELASKLSAMVPMKGDTTNQGYIVGPHDLMIVENVIFNKKPQSDRLEATATIRAEYVNKKRIIKVTSELVDVTTQQVLYSMTEMVSDTYSYKGQLKVELPFDHEQDPRTLIVKSLFWCLDEPKAQSSARSNSMFDFVNSFVAAQPAFRITEGSEFIKSFTLNDPVIRPEHKNNPNHTQVKVSYTREGMIPDYDYKNDENPFKDGNHERIMVRLKFSTTIETQPGYYILGLDENEEYLVFLRNVVNGTIYHYGGFDKIEQKQEAWDDQNRCVKMTITFPETWDNVLDFKTVGYQAYTDIYFHASFVAVLKSSTAPEEEVELISLSVKSDDEPGNYNLLNIRCAQIYIQWGCVGKETELVMADRSLKRADEIAIGDWLLDVNGNPVQVRNIFTGSEHRLYDVQTAKRHVRVTPAHMMSTDEGLRMAIDLQVGMHLNTVDGVEPITALEWSIYDDTVYNFEFEQETLIVGNGIVIGDSMLQNRKRELALHEN